MNDTDPLTTALAPIRQRCGQPGTPDAALLQAAYAQACEDRERLLRAVSKTIGALESAKIGYDKIGAHLASRGCDVLFMQLAAILRGEEP